MRAIAGSILILAAVQFHQAPLASRPFGRGLLCLLVVFGVWYLVVDLLGERRPRFIDVLLGRFWDWLLNGSNFLIKGTLLGALLGPLASLTFFGPSRIGNLAAIPGAALGLVCGVALDALAHRRQYQQPTPQSGPAAAEVENPLTDAPRRPLVESQGWDLSLGAPHTVADWPRDSNPTERR